MAIHFLWKYQHRKARVKDTYAYCLSTKEYHLRNYILETCMRLYYSMSLLLRSKHTFLGSNQISSRLCPKSIQKKSCIENKEQAINTLTWYACAKRSWATSGHIILTMAFALASVENILRALSTVKSCWELFDLRVRTADYEQQKRRQ